MCGDSWRVHKACSSLCAHTKLIIWYYATYANTDTSKYTSKIRLKNDLISQFWRIFIDFYSEASERQYLTLIVAFFELFVIFIDTITKKQFWFFLKFFLEICNNDFSFTIWKLNFDLKCFKVFDYFQKRKNLIIFRPNYSFNFQILENYSELHMSPESSWL